MRRLSGLHIPSPTRRGAAVVAISFCYVAVLTACGFGADSRLARAAKQGDLPRVRALLADGANPNARSKEGLPALEGAIRAGHPDIAMLLVDHGADVNAKAKEQASGSTALTAAAFVGDSQLVTFLLEKGADINARTGPANATPLAMAALMGRLEVTRILLDHDAGSAVDRAGAMVAAAWAGHEAVVRLLISNGAPVEGARNKEGRTALLAAIATSKLIPQRSIVQLLLSSGSNVRAVDSHGNTALTLAINGDPELVPILLEHGADPSSPDRTGQIPLEHAIAAERPDVVRMLLERGADSAALTSTGRPPLSMAAMLGFPEVIKVLLSHGADVNQTDRKGLTPLMHAVVGWSDPASMSRRRAAVALLVRSGANVQTQSPKGATALSLAEDAEALRILQSGSATQ